MLVFSVSDLASFSLTPGIFFSSGVSASLFVFSTTRCANCFSSFSDIWTPGVPSFSVSLASRIRFCSSFSLSASFSSPTLVPLEP